MMLVLLMTMLMMLLLTCCKGIDCPRAGRSGPGIGGTQPADEYGEEALTFTRDLVLQREVWLSSFCAYLVQVNVFVV